ncbi:MAG: hypothetical protein ACI9PP_000772 [Halobacteriales archaeon]|jgi:hypothetical protein
MHPDRPPDATPELPTLEPGVQLLAVDGDGHPTGPLQSLVLDHLLLEDGTALWVDANGHATTRPLARIAPSTRTLERIHLARGFTAHQHYAIVDDLPEAVDAVREPSLLVLPAFDAMYREDDLPGTEGRDLFLRGLSTVARIAREREVPVLVTRAAADEFAAPLSNAADRTIGIEHTRFGPRFVGDDVETLVYPQAAGGTVQTTLAYWATVLRARHPRASTDEPASPAVPARAGR